MARKNYFPLALGLTIIGSFIMASGINRVRVQNILEKQGISVQGELQAAEMSGEDTLSPRRFYKLHINYLGHQGKFGVDRETFRRYTRDGSIVPGTTVEILYLEQNPETAEVKEMMGKWFYQFPDGPGSRIIVGSIFLLSGLVSWIQFIQRRIRRR